MSYHNFVSANQLFSERKNIFYNIILIILGSFISLILLFNLLSTNNAIIVKSPTGVFNQLGNNIYDLISLELSTPTNNVASVHYQNNIVSAKPLPVIKHHTNQIVEIKHGYTLNKIAKKFNVSLSDIAEIMKLPAAKILTNLQIGEKLTLELNEQHSLIALSYPLNNDQTLVFLRHGNQFISKTIGTIDITTKLLANTIIIKGSLARSLAGFLPSANIDELVNMISKQQIIENIQSGDKLSYVYQQFFDHQKETHIGDILAAKIASNNHSATVIRYTLDGSMNYYTDTGASLDPAFLRAPLHYTCISSPFNLHRMQPILHIIRPHYGVDFAAPAGTAVFASSNGTISYIGQKNGYGNVIDLTYDRTYSTVYAHLARFATNIHQGSFVHEGETIGYVGMTGLATGPNLHYEFHVNDVPVNPLSVKLPGAVSLYGYDKIKFLHYIAPIMTKLNQITDLKS